MMLRHKVLAHMVGSGLLLWSSFGEALPAFGQQTSADDHGQSSAQSISTVLPGTASPLPDSPGATAGQSSSEKQPLGTETLAQSQAPPDPPPTPQRPVGTAAAEAPYVSGVAASQPAGVAIAPAKQRRLRTILIRTGVIIGAGVAIGTVVALSEATSSKPPGAH
jgi:cytoskeletal protein RodZ